MKCSFRLTLGAKFSATSLHHRSRTASFRAHKSSATLDEYHSYCTAHRHFVPCFYHPAGGQNQSIPSATHRACTTHADQPPSRHHRHNDTTTPRGSASQQENGVAARRRRTSPIPLVRISAITDTPPNGATPSDQPLWRSPLCESGRAAAHLVHLCRFCVYGVPRVPQRRAALLDMPERKQQTWARVLVFATEVAGRRCGSLVLGAPV